MHSSNPNAGYIIVETNYRVYAYTDSSLQVALLALFSDLMYRLVEPCILLIIILSKFLRKDFWHFHIKYWNLGLQIDWFPKLPITTYYYLQIKSKKNMKLIIQMSLIILLTYWLFSCLNLFKSRLFLRKDFWHFRIKYWNLGFQIDWIPKLPITTYYYLQIKSKNNMKLIIQMSLIILLTYWLNHASHLLSFPSF